MIGSLSPRGRVLTFDPPTVEVPKGVLRKNLITTTLPPARHRLGTSTSAGSLFGALHDSPAAKAVLIGAGGLSLFGAATAHAAPVNAEATTTAAKGPRSIVYVGMNKDSSYEVAGLRAKIGEGGVTYLTSSKTQDGLTLNGKSYDLTKPEGRSDYAAALGLPADRAAALAEILADTPEGARDEAAQLARTFREAEQGKRTIERIVLSGHSVGSGVWGDGNGTLSLSVVGKLTLLFPKAAAQVEDFMLAANEAVAKHLDGVPAPAVYRVHDKPDATRLADLRVVLEPLGYDLPEDPEEITPAVFQELLSDVEGTPEERFVTELVLRSQKKALYSPECRGHYALAAPY